jgi:predicted AlkP superfamily pyrophosphatase or phosphodiesterase
MKHPGKHLFALIWAGLLAVNVNAQVEKSLAGPPPPSALERIVVVVSIDGMAAYFLDDPKADMPTIRRLAREGARADGMKCAMPSVTWPTHTTLATGVSPAKHGVIGNSYWDRTAGKSVPLIPDPLFDKDEIVKVPTIYDVVHRAGLRTAAVCWPASRNAKTLNWTVPDIFPDDLFQKYSTASWLAELREENIPYEMQQTWCKSPTGGVSRDWMYSRMACQLIRKHRPHLLMVHLVEADHVLHAKGPKSADAYWVCSYEDDRVRDIFETLEKGFPGRATLIVLSDHGFAPYTREIKPNVKLKQDGFIKMNGTNVVSRQAVSLGQGGSTFVYVLDKDRRSEILGKLAGEFRDVEGVDVVIEEKDFHKYGMITADKDQRMADLVLSAKPGFSFNDSIGGDAVVTPPSETVKGTHGYDPGQPLLRSMFVAWGAGIRSGTRVSGMNSTDVAPTVARLLGLKMQDVDGEVREEILEKR